MYGFNAYYDKKQKSYGNFFYRRIREYPHGFGNGCFIEDADPKGLKEIVDIIVNKIKYYGIVDAEFRIDPKDKKFKIVEINPRCWMQSSFPTRFGKNIPYISYMDAIGKIVKEKENKSDYLKWIFTMEDIISSIQSMKKKELQINKWIQSYKGKKEHAVFSWDDPLPSAALYGKSIFTIFLKK